MTNELPGQMESARSAVRYAYTQTQSAIQALRLDANHSEEVHEALDAIAALLSLCVYSLKEITHEVYASREPERYDPTT